VGRRAARGVRDAGLDRSLGGYWNIVADAPGTMKMTPLLMAAVPIGIESGVPMSPRG
jgi:hypothetical protein